MSTYNHDFEVPKQFSSVQIRQSFRQSVDTYVDLLRIPARGDTCYGNSDAYEISPVRHIINTALLNFLSMTWSKTERNFSIILSNLDFTRDNLSIVKKYLEASARLVSKYIDTTPSFYNVVHNLTCDFEEIGYCYAFMYKDKASKLGYSLKYLHHDSIEFLTDCNGMPNLYVVKHYGLMNSPISGESKYSNSSWDCNITVFFINEKGKWASKEYSIDGLYAASIDIRGGYSLTNYQNNLSCLINESTWDKGEPIEYDYKPILHSRNNANSDNVVGVGTGLNCLSIIKELHNCYGIRKKSIISNSKALFVCRSTGLQSESNTSGSSPSVEQSLDSIKQSVDHSTSLESSPEETLKANLRKSLFGFSPHNILTSKIIDEDIESSVVCFTTNDTETPIRDQVYLDRLHIDIQGISLQIHEYEQQIQLQFEQDAFFKMGKSRMTTSEVNARQELDKRSQVDQSNPIVMNILEPYITKVITSNAKGLLNPDPNVAKSEIKNYTTYPPEEAGDADVFSSLVKYMSNPLYFDIDWAGHNTDAKDMEELSKLNTFVDLSSKVQNLKSMNPQIDDVSIMKKVADFTNIQTSPLQTRNDIGVSPESARETANEYMDSPAELI